jgi:hypothetical protein
MWRSLDELAGLLDAPSARPTESQPRGRGAERRRLRVADGLCSVARHAAPRARRRHDELLLIARAAAVRSELLEVAALVRWSPHPDPDCLAELHALLTNGCDSPLYNLDVPAEQLAATLHRARITLGNHTAVSDPTHTSQGGTACQ